VRRLSAPVTALLALLVLAAPPGAAAQTTGAGGSESAAVVISGDVAVEHGETLDGVFIVSGDARIAGRVDGDVVLVAGDAVVAGRIDGDLVTIAGRAHLLPPASVGGDVIYGDERPRVAPAATVAGEIDKRDLTDTLGAFSWLGVFLFWLAMTASALVLGILLLLIAPRAADAAYRQAETRFWTAVGIGAGIFVALPIVAAVAAITLIGLPLAFGILLMLLPLAAIAYVASAWTLGRAIVRAPRDRILAFLAGLAILRALALVPFFGALVWIAAVVVGLGVIGGAIAAARSPAEARAPAG
jgi:cytoskeletal protein CcmA (bactofilin family)